MMIAGSILLIVTNLLILGLLWLIYEIIDVQRCGNGAELLTGEMGD